MYFNSNSAYMYINYSNCSFQMEYLSFCYERRVKTDLCVMSSVWHNVQNLNPGPPTIRVNSQPLVYYQTTTAFTHLSQNPAFFSLCVVAATEPALDGAGGWGLGHPRPLPHDPQPRLRRRAPAQGQHRLPRWREDTGR